jgi:hypothetical protein
MTDKDYEWAESNDLVCSMLRHAHDVLAMTPRPNQLKRELVGLTAEEIDQIHNDVVDLLDEHWMRGGRSMRFPLTFYRAIETKLKEKNA